MEKLRIIYQVRRGRRGGMKREKYMEYIVGFKFDTPEQRDEFKESVKEWYYGEQYESMKETPDEPKEVKKPAKKKPGRPKKVVVS